MKYISVVTYHRVLCALAASALIAGCDKGTGVTKNNEEPAIRLDPALANVAPKELDRLEADATTQLLARTPEKDRATMREILSNPHVTFNASGDAEAVRLLSVIASARAARRGTLTEKPAANFSVSAPSARTIVRVALVSNLPKGDRGARAVIRREPGDGGRPLIILPEHATPGDAERALKAAIASMRSVGPEPQAPATLRLKNGGGQKAEASKRGKEALEYARSVELKDHPGIGRARVVYVSVR